MFIMRPEALWLLLPALVIFIVWFYRKANKNSTVDWIDVELIDYMLEQQPQKKSQWLTWLIVVVVFTLIMAIAGPSFYKIPQPVSKNQDALIILLDMSLSMNAEDIKPSRAIRVKQKTIDIIRQRQDGQTAIIAYAGLAHTVSPFTDDLETIEHLITSLSPDIMPKLGSRPDKAIKLASELTSAGGFKQAQALLITDGIRALDIDRIEAALNPNLKLSVIAIGTDQGAPVRLADNSFLKDGRGNIILPSLSVAEIKRLAQQLNAPWTRFSLNDSDWKSLLTNSAISDNSMVDIQSDTSSKKADNQFDQWLDQGYWLALCVVPLMLLLFRPGLFLPSVMIPLLLPVIGYLATSTMVITLLLTSHTSYAETNNKPPLLERWFSTPDQQASKRFQTQPELAAELFNNPRWKAQALYESQQYQQAEQLFQQDKSANGYYNLANSLAKQGKYQQAIDNYQTALDLQPELDVARINKQRIEDFLKQQQNQPQSDSQNSQSEQPNSGGSQSNQKDSQSSENNTQQDGNQQNNQADSQSQQDQQQGQQQNQQFGKQQSDSQNSDKPVTNDSDLASSKSDIDQFNKNAEISDTNSSFDDNAHNGLSNDTEEIPDSSSQVGQVKAQQEALNREQQAALQNLLNRVEDTPGTLLQRKFLYQYRQDQDQQDEDLLW